MEENHGPGQGQESRPGGPQDLNPQSEQISLQNTTPAHILDVLYFVLGFLEKYGWFLAFGLIVIAFLWKKVRPHLRELQRRWEEQRDIANFDPQRAASQFERMAETRRRWQEIQEVKTDRHLEKQQLLEEQKRQEKIEDWEQHQQGKGYRSKKHKQAGEDTSQNVLKPKKKPLRDSDHNPLSGGGGSPSYRPPRRGTGGGGG